MAPPISMPTLAPPSRGSDAIEKQHDFRALAQHRDRDHERERGKRLRAGNDSLTGGAHVGGKLAAVPRHPDIMPAEHQHREAENAGVEQFLAVAAEQLRQSASKQRHQAGAKHAGRDAAGDPTPAARHARGHRHDDADDQSGLENLTKDDQKRRKHGHLTAQLYDDSWHDQKPLRLAMEIVEEIIAARFQRPHMDDPPPARRDHLLEMQHAAFELGGDASRGS